MDNAVVETPQSKKTARITIPVAVRTHYLANPFFTGPLHDAFEAHRDKPEMRIQASELDLYRLGTFVESYDGDDAKLQKGFKTLANAIDKALESIGGASIPLPTTVDHAPVNMTAVEHVPVDIIVDDVAVTKFRGRSTSRKHYVPNNAAEKARQHGLATALNKREKVIGKRGEMNRRIIVDREEGDYNLMFHATKGPRKRRIVPFVDIPPGVMPTLDFDSLEAEYAVAA